MQCSFACRSSGAVLISVYGTVQYVINVIDSDLSMQIYLSGRHLTLVTAPPPPTPLRCSRGIYWIIQLSKVRT